MSAQTHGSMQDQAEFEALGQRGRAIYEDRLKAILEPEQNNRFVAIHVDSGDYTVGRSSSQAMRAMHEIHPNGQLFIRKIGLEPEYGLSARILASDMMAGKR